jgi:hypothetical protein
MVITWLNLAKNSPRTPRIWQTWVKALGCYGLQIQLSHDTSHLIAANLTAFSLQLFNNPAGTITAPGYFEYLFDSAFQLCFTRPVIIRVSAQIIIKAAPANPHNRTQYGYGKGLHLLPDKIESHFDSLAKKAAAFFNISRSIKRRLFSILSLLSSSSISLTDPEF